MVLAALNVYTCRLYPLSPSSLAIAEHRHNSRNKKGTKQCLGGGHWQQPIYKKIGNDIHDNLIVMTDKESTHRDRDREGELAQRK
jgi:hypothetical protein